MPLSQIIRSKPGQQVGFWKLTETVDELLQMYNAEKAEREIIDQMAPKRALHYLASRLLARTFFPEGMIEKDSWGKPSMQSGMPHMSWSHSGNFAAFISDEAHATGIDIETVEPRIQKLENKFCNATDKKSIHRIHHSESLLLIWGAKESMYKLYGRKEVDFRLHMTVEPFETEQEGDLFGRIHLPDFNCEIHLKYQFIEAHAAVWVHEIL